MKPRNDDYEKRRKHLEAYSDEELKTYFFELTDQIVNPMMDLAFRYTSPAIERSVLMRMGFSSLEAKAITDQLNEHDLLPFGAGHIVYYCSKSFGYEIREAGLNLMEGKHIQEMTEVFKHETE